MINYIFFSYAIIFVYKLHYIVSEPRKTYQQRDHFNVDKYQIFNCKEKLITSFYSQCCGVTKKDVKYSRKNGITGYFQFKWLQTRFDNGRTDQ